MFHARVLLRRLARLLRDLIAALEDAPEGQIHLTDAEIPLPTSEQVEASSLSVALYQMGLIGHLPEPLPSGPTAKIPSVQP